MTDDLTRLRTENLRLRSVLHDRITGLPSVPLLFDELRALLDARRSIGILHLAVPALPFVESVYGWQTFDRIVGEQASILESLRGTLLPTDARFAQTGIHGEEMIVAIPAGPGGAEVDALYLQAAAAGIEDAARARLATEEFATIVPRLDPRAGFALLSENPFYRFERLVYRAIEEARALARRRDDRRRRSWGAEVEQLIREANIIVHFQPVVDLETFEVVGYEALSRGPQGSGLETPAILFARSRDAGLGAELDRLCRRAALTAAHGIGRQQKIFLNTRADHLGDPDWQNGTLEELLAALGLAPGDLVVEFPETGAVGDDAAVERSAAGLRRRGFLLAIDDIGTGYAGIQAIERIRPDFLKIDISLVRHIDSSLIRQDLLRSLVAIGGRLEAPVIAEGIESREELDFLRTHGARYGQGFLFSKATPEIVPGPIVLGRDH